MSAEQKAELRRMIKDIQKTTNEPEIVVLALRMLEYIGEQP